MATAVLGLEADLSYSRVRLYELQSSQLLSTKFAFWGQHGIVCQLRHA